MNLLVEIGHPAHVHFFKNPTRMLEERGWHVHFVARDKAETLNLLDDEGRDYQILAESSSNLRKPARLLPDGLQIYKMAKRRRIKVLAGISAVHSAIARLPVVSCVWCSESSRYIRHHIPDDSCSKN